MQKFQDILAEAAQLKETQLKKERKNYESLPDYLKAGLNYSKKYQALRKQDYMIQMNLSQKLKKSGNTLFKKEKYDQALAKYEEALAIFRYINTKTYDNMKDDDLEYRNFSLAEEQKGFKEEYEGHLVALYLNICSCLTKTNKKEDAVHSADEALKIRQTAKAYYKKAQAYLRYINREGSDIKVGFFFLNKCYEISKDPTIVQEMHSIKLQIDEERKKEKQWFKFMFDKNSNTNSRNQPISVQKEKEKPSQTKSETTINQELQEQLQRVEMGQKQEERLEKTKEKLSKFVTLDLSEEQWTEDYQGEFIAKHGSKIYSIVQLLGYKQHLGEYRSLLAQCLEFKKSTQSSSKKKEAYSKYLQWLRDHPMDKINKYLERYELQTKWIAQKRAALKTPSRNQSLKNDTKTTTENPQAIKEQKSSEEVKPEQQLPQKQQEHCQLKQATVQTKEEVLKENKQDETQLKKEQKPLKEKSIMKHTALVPLFLIILWIIWLML